MRLWLIDLDNTLYDASWRVMGEINRRMTAFVARKLGLTVEQASSLRQCYWHRYGATLRGLIRHHRICAKEFLRETHPHDELAQFVRRIQGERQRMSLLRGRKWLLTNAPHDYAMRILQIMRLDRSFERIITIEDMKLCGGLRPKPSALMMRNLLRQTGMPAQKVTLVDDHNENLRAAHRIGIRTARIWASHTALQRARNTGRPLQIRRPAYVKVQVHSLQGLARAQRSQPVDRKTA